MRHFLFSLGVVLASSSLVVQAPLPLQASAESHSLISRLETALNASDQEELDALIAPEVRERLAPKMRRFAQRFRNARWSLKVGDLFSDGRLPVSVAVTGTTQKDGLLFFLRAHQQLALSTTADLISGLEVLKDESILKTATSAMPVTLQIPDAVLSGSRYDVDVVLDEPLGQALLAGGLTTLSASQAQRQSSPYIRLAPLGGGGLFKSVQAPLMPGLQTCAAMLVHPDGVITITKQVRVVSDRSQL